MKREAISVTAVMVVVCLVGGAVATVLDITPVEDFEPSGCIGGPFTPSSKDYQLTNTGPNSLWWGGWASADWLEVDPELGPLEAYESIMVTVSLTAAANSLPGGVHTDTLTFLDFTNDEEQTRGVTLSIAEPNALQVTPLEDFESSGEAGGPFTPASKDYQLTNIGPNTIWYGVYETADWLEVDPELGLLEPNGSTLVTVSLTSQAYALVEGVYADTLTFHDFTNEEEESRGATLTVTPPAGLWVSPPSFDVNVIEGLTLTETLTIGNNGLEDLDFVIRTRVVDGGGASVTRVVGEIPENEPRLFSAPQDHDFSVAANVAHKPDELIVRFAAKVSGEQRGRAEKNEILASLGGGTVIHDFKLVPGLSVVKLPTGMSVEEGLRSFNKVNGIMYAEPDYQVKACSTFPNDDRFDDLWGMHNWGQTGGIADADIDAPEAWDIGTGSSEIVVAVIDTGVDYTHVDLANNMWVNEAEYYGTPGVDDDGNGYIDDIYGYDFCNYDGNPMDDHYHGTHCSGTVGAIGDNGEGVAGVCWDVRIMALKFLDSGGGGWTSDAINCVEYSVLMGANLSSNSWGGGGYSQGLKDAIDAAGAAGMLFVAAAGNDDGLNNDLYPHYPSSYNCESVIAVLSTNHNDNMSSFSNYGPTSVDLGAPGSDILSCKLGGGYKYASGTSMATPHVAGACALLWSMNPVLSNSEVKDIILQTVDPTLPGLCVSEGRLNLYGAILETRAPWIEIEPEEGSVGAGDSNAVSVTFNAIEMAPGTYEADIIVMSNDPCNPMKIVPATMTVTADDLSVTPDEDFESTGTEGGPFEPACMTYTLTNNGPGPVGWTTLEVEDWLEVDPNEGILDPCESIDVNVCISVSADLLEPNIYTQVLTFMNTDSNSIKLRTITLKVKPPDCFTEQFDEGSNDLGHLSLTFSPDGSIAYYEACRERVMEFPTDPNEGTYISLGDDDYAEIVLSDGKEVLFYGQWYDRLYIGSNGYITFGQGDTEYTASLENHFNMPRISPMFADLAPADSQSVSFKQLDDRAVVTFEGVPLYGDKESENSFQVEVFFVDGAICITWLDLAGGDCVVGLSQGRGLPPVFFVESNLNQYPACWPIGDLSRDYLVNFIDFAMWAAYWLEEDCNVPYWCGKSDLDFSGTTSGDDLALLAENWLITVDWWLQPIAHWKFDEGEGDIACDSAGTNHGTIHGAQWTTGHIDGALDFDGVDDYVETVVLDIDIVTAAAWIYVTGDTIGSEQDILNNCENGGYILLYDYGGNGKAGFFAHINGGYRTAYSDTTIEEYEWYHTAGTYDGNDGYFYLDGILQADSFGDDGAITDTGLPLLIGANPETDGSIESGKCFNGKIDDVRVYDRALSGEEIQQLYQEGFSNKASNPNPADGASSVDPNRILSWSPGKDALSHDVYLGTDYNDVNDANTSDPNVFMGNQDTSSWDPCGLDRETTYYWRIDEVGASMIYRGDIWSFTTWESEPEPDPNLISWWKFDEGEGTTAYDSAGDNDGNIYGAQWTTGQIDGALDFDGEDDYVETVVFDIDVVTAAAWIYVTGDTIGSEQDILNNCEHGGYTLLYDYGGNGKLAFFAHINGGYRTAYSDSTIEEYEWYHAAGTYDGNNGYFYLDGIQQADSFEDDGVITDTGLPLLIGANPESGGTIEPGRCFNGKIDDVRVYDRALSDEEIWQLYQKGVASF